MSRTLKIILAINLLLLVALTFAWPHLLVAPGKLIPVSLTAVMEPPMFGVMEPQTGS